MRERQGPPWAAGPWGPGPGRRFRRGGLVALVVLVLVVAMLASLVAAIASGNPPAPALTVAVSAVVLVALLLAARWLWRTTRSVGALMDAADRVAGGDYSTRVGPVPGQQLQRLAGAFDQMTERLETSEERRRELLADVAHELRTPLQAIRGSIDGMLEGLYPADADHLRPVIERTELMARLLDDLRTLSMAEAGVLTVHREVVDPVAAARDAVDAVRPLADRAGVTVAVERTASAPSAIEADPVRLDEVFTNLLTNAIQHTPSNGRVVVTIDRGPGGDLACTIDDSGEGIPTDQLPFVFDRFVTTADTGGTGLGLAIARRLIEAHGGTIEATAAPPGGTRIGFRIPDVAS